MTNGSDLAPGSLVAGKYEILGPLGRGGSATVYRALQTASGTHVALKVMHQGLPDGVGERERFVREAELVQQLRHPHIVRLLDYGYTEQDMPYLAFALLVGRSLEERIHAEGGLEWLEVGRLSAQVLRALEKAHAREIVHRDIKPANIYLVRTPLGEVAQVLDFGLAKVVKQSEDDELTRVGSVLGTPRYLSPEQARGETVGQAADIYSLGLVMAEMLSGRPVVEGNTHFEMFVRHGSDAAHELPVEVLDSPFAAIIRRAIDKQPNVRYRLASQMLADVEAAIDKLEDWQEADGEGDEGDFIVTKMLDSSTLAPGGKGNAASEQLRRAFNLLARKTAPGSQGPAAAPDTRSGRQTDDTVPAAATAGSEAGPLEARPTRRPAEAAAAHPDDGAFPVVAPAQAAAIGPTATSATIDDEPTASPATERTAIADDESEPEPATCVANFDMLGLDPMALAPPPRAPAAVLPAAAPLPIAPVEPAGRGLGMAQSVPAPTALIDTTGWPVAPPIPAAPSPPAPARPPAVDFGATAYLPMDEPTFEPPTLGPTAPAVTPAPPTAFASGIAQPRSAWAVGPTGIGPDPTYSAPAQPTGPSRAAIVVVMLLVAVAIGALLRLFVWP